MELGTLVLPICELHPQQEHSMRSCAGNANFQFCVTQMSISQAELQVLLTNSKPSILKNTPEPSSYLRGNYVHKIISG
jgi:hypothetical protein